MTYLLMAAAWGADWEGRFDAGAEIGPTSVGILDAAVKRGPWSLALQTDTLDARYAPDLSRGRAWIGLRTAAFAAGLLILPWEDGAPVPDQALRAGYVGPDGGYLRYLPHGFYLGASGGAHLWWFYESSPADAPKPTPVGTADAIVGWWKPWGNAEIQAGTDVTPQGWMPHARLSGQILRERGWSPFVQLRAGVADGQDRLTYTRLGGLSPYFVPLAGAAIAEFRVEDYAALRLGPAWSGESARVALFTDGAWYDGDTAVGFGAMTHLSTKGGLFADLSVGYSPWLPRQRGVAAGGWVLLGWQGRLGRAR